jgi:nickel-dependent lactate racemase
MRFSLPWGTGRVELPLPEGWRVAEVSPAGAEPPLQPAAELVRAALDAPLGAKPFSRRDLSDERVAVVIDTRQRTAAIPLMFRQVLRRLLEAGVSPDRVRLLFATGTDPALDDARLVSLLGWAGALPFQARCSAWDDPSRLSFLGKTRQRTPVYIDRWLDDTDLIVVLGAADADPFFGFGGGLRAVVPGCAGRETLEAYPDLLAAQPSPWLAGVGAPTNPLAADADEAARMCPAELLVVSAVLDAGGQLVRAVAGEPDHVARAVAEALDARYALEVPTPADVVVASSTPFDADLREGLRAVALAAPLVTDGGTVLACLKCDQGVAPSLSIPRFVPNTVLRLFLETVGNQRVLKYVRKTWRDLTPEEVMWAWLVLVLLRRRRLLVWAPNLSADAARRLGPVEWFGDLDEAFDRVAKTHSGARAYLLAHAGLSWKRPGLLPAHA